MTSDTSSSYSYSISSLASGALTKILSPAYQPSIYLARQACISLLSKLDQNESIGVLEIIEENGEKRTLYGNPKNKQSILSSKNLNETENDFSHAILNVKNEIFWIRLALGSDLGFAESFMLAEVETPNLSDCFKIFIDNRDVLSNLSIGLISKASSYLQSVLNKRYANTKSGSLRNIGAHYDISNRMYEAFLSKDMMYSCAVYPSLDGDLILESSSLKNLKAVSSSSSRKSLRSNLIAPSVRYDSTSTNTGDGQLTPPDSIKSGSQSPSLLASSNMTNDELEDAQLRKVRIHLDRASLKPEHRLLEIGTGWGTLAIEAVKRSGGCKVESLTLSKEQKALAEKRIEEAGLQDHITVHLLDYRDMPKEWNNSFDRIISIEMIEAVGIEFLSTYFENINRVLKPKVGICVIQVITMPEERFDEYINQVDFIRKWIFPGGVLPSVTSLIDAATKGSNGTLILDTCHSIGPHYARTLREWRQRFEDKFDSQIAPALLHDHSEIQHLPFIEKQKQIQIFKRKWLYYFIYCEIGFTERIIGDHILSFTRSGNKSLPVCCI